MEGSWCRKGFAVTASPPTWLTAFFSTFTCPALPHCHRLKRKLPLGPKQASPPHFLLSVKKGPDKLHIYICMHRNFQRHTEGNGLAECRCYLRRQLFKAFLQLHYLSREIRFVCIFPSIITLESADCICPSLRNEARLVVKSSVSFSTSQRASSSAQTRHLGN